MKYTQFCQFSNERTPYHRGNLSGGCVVVFFFLPFKYSNTCRETDEFCIVIFFLMNLSNVFGGTNLILQTSQTSLWWRQSADTHPPPVRCWRWRWMQTNAGGAHVCLWGETTCDDDNLHPRRSAVRGSRNEHKSWPFGEMSRVCVWTLNIIRGFTRGQVWYKQFVTRCGSYQCQWAKASRL